MLRLSIGASRSLCAARSFCAAAPLDPPKLDIHQIYQSRDSSKPAAPTDSNRPPLPTHLRAFGWVQTVRHSKNCSFLEINDGTSHRNLQVVIDAELISPDEKAQLLTGASVEISGDTVFFEQRRTNESLPEVHCKSLKVIGESSGDYPLQKKHHSREFLRSIPHLRPRSRRFGAVLRTRSRASFALHQFMQSSGFLQIHTPIITTSDCEGSGDLFNVAAGEKEKLFFNKPAFLGVSGQLHAEAFACAMSKVYTFGPTFRAEVSQTQQHLSEFWMLEPELVNASLDDCVALTRDMIVATTSALMAESGEDLEFLLDTAQAEQKRQVKEGNMGNSYADTLAPSPDTLRFLSDPEAFQTVTYDEAVRLLQAHSAALSTPVDYVEGLTREHELFLVHQVFGGKPVFVLHYPRSQKAFYMKRSQPPGGGQDTVACMDLLVPVVGEVAGGSEREDSWEVLKANMAEKAIGQGGEYDWYLDLRKYGSVPHAGFGLGFERYLQLVSATRNIRDVVGMPRAYQLCPF